MTHGSDPETVIAPYQASQLDEVVRLSLRAWEPVFESMREAMLPAVYRAFYRDDWRGAQRAAVEAVCADADMHVELALDPSSASGPSRVVGFVASKLHEDDAMGEIYMIAVDPDHQRRGIAARLTRHALAWFESAGMSIAMVETGGDPGHAPARKTYEATGFQLLPVARYFKALRE